MTNHLGVAVATQTLVHLLQPVLKYAQGAVVTQLRPEEQPPAALKDAPRINLYLVQARPDPTLRSVDLPLRDGNGAFVSVPTVPLVLRYMLSFFGKHPEPQILLGGVELALRVNGSVSPEVIRQAERSSDDLGPSGLDLQQPPLQISPAAMTIDEMGRFWSGFFHSPYTLSVFYDVAPVILQQDVPTRTTLPVHAPGPRTSDALGPRLGPLPRAPVDPGARVAVAIERPRPFLALKIGAEWAPVGDGAVTIPARTPPGTYAVVLGEELVGGPPKPVPGSPPQQLSVRPRAVQPRFTTDPGGGQSIVVGIDPPPDPATKHELAVELIDRGPSGWSTRISGGTPVKGAAARYSFAFPPPHDAPEAPGTSAQAATNEPFVKPGEYLVVVSVDGIASLPRMVAGVYARPQVRVR